jgi:hypothetical protein
MRGSSQKDCFIRYRLRPEPGPVGVKVDPLGEPFGPSVFPDGFMLLGALLVGVEPVVLPAPMPVVPFVVLPVEPPLMDAPPVAELAPPEAPPVLVCATANVLDSASAAARVIVESFMVVSLCVI